MKPLRSSIEESKEKLPSDEDRLRRAEMRVGEMVSGRWRLDCLLGLGGMAAVYGATHRNNGKRVAIKMLHPELSTNEQVKQRFIDEGYAANHVGHIGAVSVLDDEVTEDGAAFLIMDLLEGETLQQKLERVEALPAAEVLALADALLDVLASAHEHSIVHRDVKPDNIFLLTDNTVKLLDFGIARVTGPDRPRTTQWGETMGTPAFMPPEQARGRWSELDGRTDLWALGATMFYATSGRLVHQADTTNEELLSAMTLAAPSLRTIVPDVPDGLADVVDRALAFEKLDRWSDARTMQAAVRSARAALDGAAAEAERTAAFAELRAAPPQTNAGAPTLPRVVESAPSLILPARHLAADAIKTIARFRPDARRSTLLTAAAAVAAFVILLILARRSSSPDSLAKAAGSPVVETLAAGWVLKSAAPEPPRREEPMAIPLGMPGSPPNSHAAQAIPDRAARVAEPRGATPVRDGARISTPASPPTAVRARPARGGDPLSRRK